MNEIYKLKQIETPRLLIRPVQLGDEYPLNKAVNNSLELLQKWQPWAKDPSIEATRGFVQRGVFAWESGSVVDFSMVVIHKEDNKIIAASGYNDRTDGCFFQVEFSKGDTTISINESMLVDSPNAFHGAHKIRILSAKVARVMRFNLAMGFIQNR